MNRTVLCLACVLLVAAACGLEEYHSLEPPSTRINDPVYSTEPLYRYFYFWTNDRGNDSSGDFVYSGTAVYYKIYNNRSTMSSHISAIDSVNTASNMSAAATRMIETYKYQQLGIGMFGVNSSGKLTVSSVSREPLLGPADSNQLVRIRLFDYSADDPASVRAGTDAGSLSDIIAGGKPLRNAAVGAKSFFFYDDSFSDSQIPDSSDADVQYGTFTEENTWYVNAYAVAVGYDASFSYSYSLVLHLGTIAISADDF